MTHGSVLGLPVKDLDRYLDFLREADQAFSNRREYHPMTQPKLVAFHVTVDGSPVTALFDPDGRFVEFVVATRSRAWDADATYAPNVNLTPGAVAPSDGR